jgi:hypothetical protein
MGGAPGVDGEALVAKRGGEVSADLFGHHREGDVFVVAALGLGGRREDRGWQPAAGVEPDVLIGTLGKAYGAAGGFVVGPPVRRELLISAGRAVLFSTGLPEPV